MDLRIYLDNDQVGPKFRRNMGRAGAMVREAVRGAAHDAAEEIEARGADDIEDAGNFGERWTEGLHADVTEGGGNLRITVKHDVPYWRVFEFGANIRPVNGEYLWLPFSFAEDAQGLWPRAYPEPLFFVRRKSDGLPMLFSVEDKQPKYFGKEEVNIPQKFHLRKIIAQVAKELRDYYRDHMAAAKA